MVICQIIGSGLHWIMFLATVGIWILSLSEIVTKDYASLSGLAELMFLSFDEMAGWITALLMYLGLIISVFIDRILTGKWRFLPWRRSFPKKED